MPMMLGFCGISFTRKPADAEDARVSLMLMMMRSFCVTRSAHRSAQLPADADDARLLGWTRLTRSPDADDAQFLRVQMFIKAKCTQNSDALLLRGHARTEARSRR